MGAWAAMAVLYAKVGLGGLALAVVIGATAPNIGGPSFVSAQVFFVNHAHAEPFLVKICEHVCVYNITKNENRHITCRYLLDLVGGQNTVVVIGDLSARVICFNDRGGALNYGVYEFWNGREVPVGENLDPLFSYQSRRSSDVYEFDGDPGFRGALRWPVAPVLDVREEYAHVWNIGKQIGLLAQNQRFRVFLGSVGGSLGFTKGEGDQNDASASYRRFETGDYQHDASPVRGILLGLQGLCGIVLLLGAFVVSVGAFKRGGDALGYAFERGGVAWLRPIGWGLLGWAICAMGAGIVFWWASGGQLP